MTSTTDFDNVEITQQYSRINTRFELSDEELDNDNSSARLFERSRIKALAGNAYPAIAVVVLLFICLPTRNLSISNLQSPNNIQYSFSECTVV